MPAVISWTVEEEKLLLRTLLLAGGHLSVEQLAGLAEQVRSSTALVASVLRCHAELILCYVLIGISKAATHLPRYYSHPALPDCPTCLAARLCLQVGGAAAGRTVDSVGERCLHLMQRYQENRRRKAAAAAAAAAGG